MPRNTSVFLYAGSNAVEAAEPNRALRQYYLIDDVFSPPHIVVNGAYRKDAMATFLGCWKLFWESAWLAGAAALSTHNASHSRSQVLYICI